MRLLMMGTGEFAVPTFQSLLQSEHTVTGLVTRPPRPVHGKQHGVLNPMREVAQRQGVAVQMPEDVNQDTAPRRQMDQLQCDLLVVCDYGQILSPQTLAVASRGGINLHASLLPKYRGAAPINWAIYHGETATGVSIIHMTPKLDAGPCLIQHRVTIGPNETAVQLHHRLAQQGAEAVCEAIEMVARWDTTSPLGEPQDAASATKAPRLKKSDGQIDWNRTAWQIRNQVRALQPWPGTFTHWRRSVGQPLRLILHRVTADQEPPTTSPPGTVLVADGPRLVVATGSGTLGVEQIQPAGKRVLGADEFLRGYEVQPGDRFA